MRKQPEKLVPSLRFKGFTDAWEQYKLEDVGYTYSGLTGKTKNDFGVGDASYITYLNVFQNTFASKNGIDKIKKDVKQNEVKFGDILFTTSSETPEEVGMSSIWLYNTNDVYLNSFCFGLRPTINVDPHFLGFSLRTPSMRKKFAVLAQGISRYNISKVKAMDIQLYLPSSEEQYKVGSLQRKLDNLIALYQRKLEVLQSLKTNLNYNLLPIKNRKLPLLQFDKKSEWVHTNLGSYLIPAKKIEASIDSPSQLLTVKLNLQGITSGSNRETLSLTETKYYVRNVGQLLYGKQNFFNGSMGIVSKSQDGLATSADVPALNIMNIDENYLLRYIGRKNYYKEKERFSTGTGSKRIHENTLLDFEISVPDLTIQRKISKAFTHIDSLTAQYSSKIDTLNLLKRKYLNRLFI